MSPECKTRSVGLDDETPVHCFRTLVESLETVLQNRCPVRTSHDHAPAAALEVTTQAVAGKCALDLLNATGKLSTSATLP